MHALNQVEKFYAYLQELEQSYSRLAGLLRQKLNAVNAGDLGRLDQIIKEEQVYVLLSKGFDANLQSYRESLELKGNTLAEVIEELPESYRDSFTKQYRRLKHMLDEVQRLNQTCQNLIQDRLYALDRKIKELDKSENATYEKGGGAAGPQTGAGLFSKSV